MLHLRAARERPRLTPRRSDRDPREARRSHDLRVITSRGLAGVEALPPAQEEAWGLRGVPQTPTRSLRPYAAAGPT